MVRVSSLAILLIAGSALGQELPADLAAVPPSAAGFAHVRIADVWRHDALKDLRKVIEKAGPTYARAFDARFVPAPSSVERVTLIAGFGKSGPSLLVIVATSADINRDKFERDSLKNAREVKVGGKSFLVAADSNLGFHRAGDRLLIIGEEEPLKAYLQEKPGTSGPLSPAIQAAALGRPVTLAVNVAAIPNDLLSDVPPPLLAVFRSSVVQASLELKAAATLDLKLSFADARSADDAEKALKEAQGELTGFLGNYRKEAERSLLASEPGRKSSLVDLPEAAAALVALGFIARAEEVLADSPIRRAGNSLVATVKVPEGPLTTAVSGASVAAGLLLPAVQKVREAAARTQSANNLKQLALALHNYESTFASFPPAAICDKKGKPLLSWRVAILPYIEQDALYRRFKLDEPWDSPHNSQLAMVRIKVFMIPKEEKPTEFGMAHYRVFVGNGAGFEQRVGLKIGAFADGTSNTILIAESAEGVPWSKPEEFEYDPKKMPPVGFHWGGGSLCNVAFADGSVRAISRRVPESTWHLLIQRNDGNPIPEFEK